MESLNGDWTDWLIRKPFEIIGNSFIADTNFLINVHEGKGITMPFLDKFPIVSVITEIELLGYPKLNSDDIKKLNALLEDCII